MVVHAVLIHSTLGTEGRSQRFQEIFQQTIEVGFIIGCLCFAVGCYFYFPEEYSHAENVVLACRLLEVGSTIFTVLLLYSWVDGCIARRFKSSKHVSKRELWELICCTLGSFSFLIGTLLFDPPVVTWTHEITGIQELAIENLGGILFMVGSFFFCAGTFSMSLSLFEANVLFRATGVIITACYAFGGLLFVAGTMGFIAAFEPNLAQRIVATYFYVIGSVLYTIGAMLSFVRCQWILQIARQQRQSAALIQMRWRQYRSYSDHFSAADSPRGPLLPEA